MGLSKNQQPPAPNFQASAVDQANANLTAAHQNAVLNNPNVSTPYGSQNITWNDQWQPTITQSLTPTGQQTVDQQQQADLGLATLANQQTGNVGNILNSPFSFGGTPQLSLGPQGSIAGGPNASAYDTSINANPGQAQGGVNAPNLQTSIDQSGLFNLGGAPQAGQYGMAQGGGAGPQLQNRIDTSGVAASPINAGTTAQQAIMSRLAPQLAQQRTSTETQLTNQGLRPGGEAYNNAINLLGQQENDARQQAVLQGLGLDLQANQQGFGQAQSQGEFGNNAALSGYNAGLQGQQLGNQAIGQNFNQALQSQQAQNAAQGQQFGQRVQSGEFGNNAQLASFGAGLQNQQAGNQAMQQNFQNQLQSQQAQNSATNQNFQNQLQGQQAGNAAQQQGFNQNLQGAQFGNTAMQQQLAQLLQQRDLPLNEISALLSGSQVQNPQFSPYAQSTAAPAPLFQGAQAQDAYNQNLYNQQQAQHNSLLSGLFGLGGTVLGGPLGGMLGKGIGSLF